MPCAAYETERLFSLVWVTHNPRLDWWKQEFVKNCMLLLKGLPIAISLRISPRARIAYQHFVGFTYIPSGKNILGNWGGYCNGFKEIYYISLCFIKKPQVLIKIEKLPTTSVNIYQSAKFANHKIKLLVWKEILPLLVQKTA